MESKTRIIVISAIVLVSLIGIGAYAMIRSQRTDRTAAQRPAGIIRNNAVISGTIVDKMPKIGMITIIANGTGKMIDLALVSETKLLDENGIRNDLKDMHLGFSVTAKGEAITPDALIPSEIRMTRRPEIDITIPENGIIGNTDSPLSIEGKAKGGWFFEGTFPIEILDAQRRQLGKGTAQAQGEWTTVNPVPFKADVAMARPTTPTGYIVFKNDNPSGSKENEKTLEIPVTFGEGNRKARIFFSHTGIDKEYVCDRALPAWRALPQTASTTTARAVLEELLKGPDETERSAGYITNLDKGATIRSFDVIDGTVRVDLSEETAGLAAGTCRASAIRAQIAGTLEQFPFIGNIELSIEGRPIAK